LRMCNDVDRTVQQYTTLIIVDWWERT